MPVNRVNSMGTVASGPARTTNSGKSNVFAEVLKSSGDKSKANLEDIFEAASKKYGVPVSLIKAVAKAESNFNSHVTSHCGAMGIMQLMPETAKSLGVKDAYDPEQNIMGGAKYLRRMLDEFDGDVKLAIAAYNAGPGNVKKFNGIPPFNETQNYVKKVIGFCGCDISACSVQPWPESSLNNISAPSVIASAENLSPALNLSLFEPTFNPFEDDKEKNEIL